MANVASKLSQLQALWLAAMVVYIQITQMIMKQMITPQHDKLIMKQMINDNTKQHEITK